MTISDATQTERAVRGVGNSFARAAEASIRRSLAITSLSALGDLEPQESPAADIESETAWNRAVELARVLTRQGATTLFLWSDLCQAESKRKARDYPNARPQISHILIRRLAVAEADPEKPNDIGGPLGLARLAVRFVECIGEGERPLEYLADAIGQLERSRARAAHALAQSVSA